MNKFFITKKQKYLGKNHHVDDEFEEQRERFREFRDTITRGEKQMKVLMKTVRELGALYGELSTSCEALNSEHGGPVLSRCASRCLDMADTTTFSNYLDDRRRRVTLLQKQIEERDKMLLLHEAKPDNDEYAVDYENTNRDLIDSLQSFSGDLVYDFSPKYEEFILAQKIFFRELLQAHKSS